MRDPVSEAHIAATLPHTAAVATVLARQIVRQALALRASHPHAPARDVLDLVLHEREAWVEDLLEFMVPSHAFALLVAEAVDDPVNAARCRTFSALGSDEYSRNALQRKYMLSVWPKFMRRYGIWHPARRFSKRWSELERWAEQAD